MLETRGAGGWLIPKPRLSLDCPDELELELKFTAVVETPCELKPRDTLFEPFAA